jgi:hypothetical protein
VLPALTPHAQSAASALAAVGAGIAFGAGGVQAAGRRAERPGAARSKAPRSRWERGPRVRAGRPPLAP